MPTFEISYHGSDHVSNAFGKTRSGAKYNKFLDFDGAFETFKDFLKIVKSVRKVGNQKDAYGFIQRQYGMTFLVGQMVEIVGEGSASGKIGEVIHPSSGGGSYVHVLMDGKQCLFHPRSLRIEQ